MDKVVQIQELVDHLLTPREVGTMVCSITNLEAFSLKTPFLQE